MKRLLLVVLVFASAGYALWHLVDRRAATTSAAVAAPGKPNGGPKVVAPDNVLQFGIINPGDRRTHKFVVRNDGDAELELSLGSTTCKCTLANLREARVAPGSSTEIELEWHAEDPQFRFRQAAVVKTNDPATPEFELAVEGSVRVKLGSIPEDISLLNCSADDSRISTAILYSQAYDEVRIERIESTLPTATATVADAEPHNVALDHARWLRDVVIVKRPESKAGSFDGVIKVHYVGRTSGGAEESGVFELPIYGSTVGDVSFQGGRVVGSTLMFGQFSRLTTKSTTAYAHFRNTPDDVRIDVVSVEPPFVQVNVEKPQRLSSSVVRIPLAVSIPQGAPTTILTDDEPGRITLKTSHPDYPTLVLPLTMIVEP